jgi:hypothetical protein
MRRSFLFAGLLLVLCPFTWAGSAEIPATPSSFLPANAVLEVAVSPVAYVALPHPPRWRVVDRKFIMFSAVSTAAIFADSYSTTWIGVNYRAHGGGPCTVEGGEPLLYGLHPTVARTYMVGAGMSAGAIAASYLAKKHLPSRLVWMWPAPLLYETSVSLHGFGANLARCNP